MEDQRFAVRAVYDYLRAKGKSVPTGKPQVVGHKVDLSGLAKACFDAGGRAQVLVCHCSSQFAKFKDSWKSFDYFLVVSSQVSGRKWSCCDQLLLRIHFSQASWSTKVFDLISYSARGVFEIPLPGLIQCQIQVNNNVGVPDVENLAGDRNVTFLHVNKFLYYQRITNFLWVPVNDMSYVPSPYIFSS